MTAPTDSRAEARALIARTDKATSNHNWWAVGCGHHLNLCEELRDALEAALDELERKDASGAQSLAALRRLHMYSDCNCGGGYVCDERRAIDAVEEAITRKALEG